MAIFLRREVFAKHYYVDRSKNDYLAESRILHGIQNWTHSLLRCNFDS